MGASRRGGKVIVVAVIAGVAGGAPAAGGIVLVLRIVWLELAREKVLHGGTNEHDDGEYAQDGAQRHVEGAEGTGHDETEGPGPVPGQAATGDHRADNGREAQETAPRANHQHD